MNELIVMTGVTHGMGRALIEYLLAQGHTVEGCGRRTDGVEISGSNSQNCNLAAVDVTNWTAVELWSKSVVQRSGAPDRLICNASVINNPARFWEVPVGEIQQVFATNVLGTMHTMLAFLPAMIQRGRGLVVAISSGWGRTTDANVAPYCASKWAVEGLTLSLAKELPDNLGAITLDPGVVNTRMLQRCWPLRANEYPTADAWVTRAGPFILSLSALDNGKQLTVPA